MRNCVAEMVCSSVQHLSISFYPHFGLVSVPRPGTNELNSLMKLFIVIYVRMYMESLVCPIYKYITNEALILLIKGDTNGNGTTREKGADMNLPSGETFKIIRIIYK